MIFYYGSTRKLIHILLGIWNIGVIFEFKKKKNLRSTFDGILVNSNPFKILMGKENFFLILLRIMKLYKL